MNEMVRNFSKKLQISLGAAMFMSTKAESALTVADTSLLRVYKSLPLWTAETLPEGFQRKHNTKEGTWAKLEIFQGRLKFYALDSEGQVQKEHLFDATPESSPPFIAPQAWHRVEPASDDLKCQLSFYCQPERYMEKKYDLTAPHSEVVELLEKYPQLLPKSGESTESRSALDLGCGRGRNSLYLQQHGICVTAVDKSEDSITTLKDIIEAEKIGLTFPHSEIDARIYDITSASVPLPSKRQQLYDLVLSTVVLQFLPAECIPAVISNLQAQTKPHGGIHLIVAPISTPQHPCPIDFPFTLQEGELQRYYKDWNILKYEETEGEFHKMDKDGNRFKALFATMVAEKVD